MHCSGDSLICVCTCVWILAAGPRGDRSRHYLHPNQPPSGSGECSTWISDLKFNLTQICLQLKFDSQFLWNSIHVIWYRIQALGMHCKKTITPKGEILGMSQGFLDILVTNLSYFSRQYVRGSYNIIYFLLLSQLNDIFLMNIQSPSLFSKKLKMRDFSEYI
jgi:hypothetical protein